MASCLNKSVMLSIFLISTLFSQISSLPLSSLEGTWKGSGRFLDIKWDKAIGRLPIEIWFGPDGIVTGSIGGAILTETKLGAWKEDGFEIRAILEGSLKEGISYKKDHFIIFGQIADSEMDLNYHLKSNFIFDFSMNVCGVNLKRVP